MGRMLGSFDPEDELDRPDLNKCPDCGCYFATDNCPLCGKVCPPEMRAGARVEPKKRRKRRAGSGRVQFVPWYHTWWFILLMMFWMPPVGIILFLTSPYRARWKVLFCAVGAAYMVFVYFGLGSRLLAYLTEKPLVNTKLTEVQYRETCLNVSPEYYYRSGATDGYYTMELTVVRTVTDNESVSGEPVVYYLCRDPDDPDDPLVEILVRDCRVQGGGRFLRGDRIAVWGQPHGDGQLVVYDGESGRLLSYPGICMAYGAVVAEESS